MSSVAGLFRGRCRRPSEFVVVTRQEGDEILGQKQLADSSLRSAATTDRQQRIVKAIQQELIECPVAIRRVRVGIQRDGLLGLGDRQLMLAGAHQGETRDQCVWRRHRAGSSRPTFPTFVAPVPGSP